MVGGTDNRRSRRQFLAGVAVGTLALAGCLSGDDDDESDDVPDDIDPNLVLNGVVLNSAFPLQLINPDTNERLADVHYHPEFRHWHAMPLSIPYDEAFGLEVRVEDTNRDPISLGEDGELQVEVEPSDGTPNRLVDIEINGEHIELYGNDVGDGNFDFRLLKDGDVAWEAPPLQISVD